MSFDPYHKWLGIPPEDQPPNFYRLLGINLYESDEDVISNAADQRSTHVRSYQTGQHSSLSQRILNELATARVCLLDPEKRDEYDATLRAQPARVSTVVPAASAKVPLAPTVAASAVPPPIPPPIPATQDATVKASTRARHEPVFVDRPHSVVAGRSKTHGKYLFLMVATTTAAIALIVGLAYLAADGAFGRRDVAQEPAVEQSTSDPLGPQRRPSEIDGEKALTEQPGDEIDASRTAGESTGSEQSPLDMAADSAAQSAGHAQAELTTPAEGSGDDFEWPSTADENSETVSEESPSVKLLTDASQTSDDLVAAARQQLEQSMSSDSPQQLIERVIARSDTDTDTFAILSIARDRAAATGDVPTAVAAIDELGTRFEMDTFDARLELLKQLTEESNERIDHRAITELALSLTDAALKRDRKDLADDCASTALGAARKSGDRELVRQATLIMVKLNEP